MSAQPPPYQLFHLRPSKAQRNVEALVSALWRTLFPGQYFGQNCRLNEIFARMSHRPELATLQICPYYFDQVTYHLPTRDQVKHMERCNLRLRCFDTWADPQREQANERQWRHHLRTNQEARPSSGVYLNQLCQLQDPNTGETLSTRQYIYLMYGHHC
ncbi:hypothetical protein PAMP_002757 [Pampus punctatissimus]